MSFLGLSGKTFLVLGVANKKSVAWHVAKTLEAEGAKNVRQVVNYYTQARKKHEAENAEK